MVERVDCLCGARTEGTYSGTWVQCGDCGVWQHWACVAGPRARPPAADEPWACGLCTRDAAAVEAMLDAVFAEGAPDILVNNAAANFLAQTHRLSARALDAVLATTLHGAAYCTMGIGRRWIDAGQPGV